MEKILFLLSCILTLISCGTDTGQSVLEACEEIKILSDYGDASVLLYDSGKIYFYELSETSEKEGTVFKLYVCDLQENQIKHVGDIPDFFASTNSVALLEDGFSFTVCTKDEESFINNLYLCRNEEIQNIYTWSCNIPFAYVNRLSESELLLFYPDKVKTENSEKYLYEVLKVDLSGNQIKKFTNFHYDIVEQEGNKIPALDVRDNRVYVFKNFIQGKETERSICVFDMEGNLLKEWEIDMGDFLYLKETGAYDSVLKLECVDDDLFILETINKRIAFFKKEGNGLVKMDIPDSLSAFPEGYKIAGFDENQGIFFANIYNDKLIKFDLSAETFSECAIDKSSEQPHISSINIDSAGSILMKMDNRFYICRDFDTASGKFSE